MVVMEMELLTTTFLRFDNQKIYYPNVVLLTKPISNFSRSPDMGDAIEFSVDVSTSLDKLSAMKAKISCYIENKPMHWRPDPMVVVKSVEDLSKMKMALFVTHTMNFQNAGERHSRRSDLVMELKKIFDELGMIKYNL